MVLKESAAQFVPSERKDIFLSHSSLDATEIYGLKHDIESMGFTVYVDWVDDPGLHRQNVNPGTPARLKERMQNCSSFFYATSPNAQQSKWMTWELGYFDGANGRVAIVPVLDTATSSDRFQGQEYLGLYPYVIKETPQGQTEHTLWIMLDEKLYVRFDLWLKGYGPVGH
jgi:hypothetical protein